MLDAYDYVKPTQTRKLTAAEQAERAKQQIFSAESGAGLQRKRTAPEPPGILKNAAICAMDDRGGHRTVGKNCPHGLLELDQDSVIEINF